MTSEDEDIETMALERTKSWKEYEGDDEIPMILAEGLLPIKFQGSECEDIDYEGALRFYCEDGQSELTKAVRLTNRTTVEELILILVEKFSLPAEKEYSLYEIHEKEDKVLLYDEECPLARAISTRKAPRFVLRQKGEIIVPPVSPNDTDNHNKKDKKKKRFSFVGEKSDKEKSEKEKSVKDKQKKEKKQEKKASKKHKIDKSSIEVNHNNNSEEFSGKEEEDYHLAVVSDEEKEHVVTLLQTASFATDSVIEEEPAEYTEGDHPAVDSSVNEAGHSVVNYSVTESVQSSVAESTTVVESNIVQSFVEPVHSENYNSNSTDHIELSPIESNISPLSINVEASSEETDNLDQFVDNIKLPIIDSEDPFNGLEPKKLQPEVNEVIEATTVTTVESSVEFPEEDKSPVDNSTSKPDPINIDTTTEQKVNDEEEHIDRSISFSNSSIFYDQDNQQSQTANATEGYSLGKKKEKKQKSKKSVKSEKHQDKHSRSFSKMLKSGRKKPNTDTLSNRELSTNKLTPGILKVFGDHVSEGSNYKAVRVSTISTAQEVVRMALERYGFENSNTKEYVLCDVVGQIHEPESAKGSKKLNKHKKSEKSETEDEDKPKWQTEYIRAVNDNEKPLILQSLWKPTNGRSRRFELRRRVDVESACFFINTAVGVGRRPSETDLFDDSEHSSVVSGRSVSPVDKTNFTPIQLSPHSRSNKISNRINNTEDSNLAPLYTPYLLLVKGCKSDSDKLVHKLDEPTIIIGPFLAEEQRQCNITLYSSDILLPHCWIYKKVKLDADSAETNLDEINFLVFIEPANGADITVNGNLITTTTMLNPGQIISFGKSYVFIFKDPTQNLTLGSTETWLDLLQDQSVDTSDPPYAVINKPKKMLDKGTQVELLAEASIMSDRTSDDDEDEEETDVSSDENDTEHVQHSKVHTNLAPRKQVNKSQLQFTYDIKEEEELLHTIIDIADGEHGEFKLTSAYFFMMAIEHSAATFTEIQTRKLLLKVSSGLQGIAWEKTKEIGKQGSIKDVDPMSILNRILPELKPVLFWMASALEMLHFLQSNLTNYLLPRNQVTTTKEVLISADEELLTVLEEVIMFTFQQTVYHLTKVLYVALPSIIDTNPFQNSNDSEIENGNKQSNVHSSIVKVTEVFESILKAATEYQVHPQIISQLFAYLFFFSNASLFNSLMEKGPDGKFYRWAKGVQMRGNLDVLEDWAQANGLSAQFEQYLGKFMSAVDLLSTPKVQIMQFEWKTMRTDFPLLNPAQLQQLLGEYQLSGKPRPRGWFPPPDEVEPALRSSEILESFATHPPLMLPSSSFIIDLNVTPENKEFLKHLDTIHTKFGVNKMNGDVSRQEVLHDEENTTPSSTEFKSKNVHTHSNIDMDNVQTAINIKIEENKQDSGDNQPQVGSVQSISVQPRKTMKITVVSRRSSNFTAVNGDSISSNGKNTSKDAGVTNLISKANDLINNNDSSDDNDDYSVPKHDDEDVFVAELARSDGVLGLGLIDGMFTSLKANGIYIRTIVPNTPASEDSRLRVGDRILAVNGSALVGAGYNHAMELIKKAGNRLSFLISKSDNETMNQVLTATT